MAHETMPWQEGEEWRLYLRPEESRELENIERQYEMDSHKAAFSDILSQAAIWPPSPNHFSETLLDRACQQTRLYLGLPADVWESLRFVTVRAVIIFNKNAPMPIRLEHRSGQTWPTVAREEAMQSIST